jgi:hypothetical protein
LENEFRLFSQAIRWRFEHPAASVHTSIVGMPGFENGPLDESTTAHVARIPGVREAFQK